MALHPTAAESPPRQLYSLERSRARVCSLDLATALDIDILISTTLQHSAEQVPTPSWDCSDFKPHAPLCSIDPDLLGGEF